MADPRCGACVLTYVWIYIFGTLYNEIFGVADDKNKIEILKFKMADPI